MNGNLFFCENRRITTNHFIRFSKISNVIRRGIPPNCKYDLVLKKLEVFQSCSDFLDVKSIFHFTNAHCYGSLRCEETSM